MYRHNHGVTWFLVSALLVAGCVTNNTPVAQQTRSPAEAAKLANTPVQRVAAFHLQKHRKLDPAKQVITGAQQYVPAVPPSVSEIKAAVYCSALTSLRGPELSRINLVLNGTSSSLHFNDYLQGHPDMAHFSAFGLTTATTTTPATPYQHAGAVPTAQASLTRTDFILSKIECTSRYGGSLLLEFTATGDVEYELRTAGFLYDFKGFVVRVYVVPTADGMRSGSIVVNSDLEPMHVEYHYAEVLAYERFAVSNSLPYTGTRVATTAFPIVDGGPAATEMKTALESLRSAIIGPSSAVRIPIRRFTRGIVRAMNAPLFTTTNVIVDAVEVSDGRIEVITHVGIRVATIMLRVNGIDVNTEGGDEEFILSIYEGYGYGFQWRNIARDMELNQNQSSRWFYLDTFEAASCTTQKEYLMHYDLVERDDAPIVGGSTIFTQPDHFDVRPHTITIQCAPLQTTPLGMVDDASVNGIEVHTENMVYDLQGTMSVRYQVSLGLR
jgi:hypothetical protein